MIFALVQHNSIDRKTSSPLALSATPAPNDSSSSDTRTTHCRMRPLTPKKKISPNTMACGLCAWAILGLFIASTMTDHNHSHSTPLLFSFASATESTTAARSAVTSSIRVCISAYSGGYLYNLDYALKHYRTNYTLMEVGGGATTTPAPLKELYWPNLNTTDTNPISISPPMDLRDSPIDIVRAYIRQDGDNKCDLFIGPSFSDAAIAQSPLMEKPLWIDPGSTSTLLSNKATYPSFLRVIPSDDQLAPKLTQLLSYFDWRDVYLIKGDTSYANSWSNSFSASFTSHTGSVRGTIVKTMTLPTSITDGTVVVELLESLRTPESLSRSRIVVVSHVEYTLFSRVVRQFSFDKDLVFVYSEMACSDMTYPWSHTHGSFCMTTGYDEALYNDYMASYTARSDDVITTPYLTAQLLSFGYTTSELLGDIRDEMDVYIAQSVDAMWYGLAVLEAFQTQHGGLLPATSVEACAFARKSNVTIRGLTGSVSVNEDGDRRAFVANLFNSAADNSSAMVGVAGSRGDSDVTFSVPSVTILGKTYDLRGMTMEQVRATIPAGRTGSTDRFLGSGSQGLSDAVIVVIVVIAVLALAGAITVAVAVFRRSLANKRRGEAIKYAPKDATRPIAVVFTDIQSSTALWAECPLEMSAALDLHNAIIRKCIAAHRGYEVKTIGDSFMIVFESPSDSIGCSLAIQQALYLSDWTGDDANNMKQHQRKADQYASSRVNEEDGDVELEDSLNHGILSAVNNFYACTVFDSSFYNHKSTATSPATHQHSGLRVRIGATYGMANIRASVRDSRMGGGSRVLSDAEVCNVIGGVYKRASSTHSSASGIDINSVTFDYFGPFVNMAARIEAIGHGGQVLVSKLLFDAAVDEARSRVNSKSLKDSNINDHLENGTPPTAGPMTTTNPAHIIFALSAHNTIHKAVELRGITDPVALVEIFVPMLSGRLFPPFRLDHNGGEVDVVGDANPSMGGGADSNLENESMCDDNPAIGKNLNAVTTLQGDWVEETHSSHSSHFKTETLTMANAAHPNTSNLENPPATLGLRRKTISITSPQHPFNSSHPEHRRNQNYPNTQKNDLSLAKKYYEDLSVVHQVALRRKGLKERDLRLGYFMLDALLSAVPPKDAQGMLKLFAQKWRVDARAETEGLLVYTNPYAANASTSNVTSNNGSQQQRASGRGDDPLSLHGISPIATDAKPITTITDGLRKVLIASRIAPVAVSRCDKSPAINLHSSAVPHLGGRMSPVNLNTSGIDSKQSGPTGGETP